MSKRFGRKKRREAREQIARLTGQLDAAERHVRISNLSLGYVKQMVRDAERVLGSYTAVLPPKTVDFSMPATMRELLLPIKTKPWPKPRPDGSLPSLLQAVKLHIMALELVEDVSRWQYHCRVDLDGTQVAYALDERSIAETPIDVLTNRISREIARVLVTELRKKGKYRAK